MSETQIENVEEKTSRKKENKSQYDQKRYMNNLEEMRKVRRDYYHANKERISEKAKKLRNEKIDKKPVGRPKKYVDEG